MELGSIRTDAEEQKEAVKTVITKQLTQAEDHRHHKASGSLRLLE